ncbi:PAAR domain-containing protein [Pseudoalteromonas sp. MMG005]|uniref:PAAR domain-containing protein n=1 Tax=Pseudoalteromonas sp. MMG005 TaxID=2822682 RepID=UPI001B39DD43|nr:PAAR domain-containing protein [Pseudoalteromonas sp. MMG005]MBQ4844959.1 PAAR domain-containing protein [Pseudoalteromonas sp. MMG005]
MPAISLDGAMTNVHVGYLPGKASATQGSFTVSGKPALREGDPISTHALIADPQVKHVGMKVSMGASSFTIEGKAVARIGDPTDCGGQLAQGEGGFTVGG